MSTETPELTLEQVQKFLTENEDGKKYFKSNLDSYATKAIRTYEDNFTKEKLPKLLEDEITKRYPAETPEQKRLKELEVKFAQADAEKNRAILQSKLLTKAQEKQLPTFLTDYSLAEDEETSYAKLEQLGNKYIENVNKEVENRLAGTGRKTPIDDKTPNPVDLNSLPNNDPDFYLKNAELIDKMMKQ